MKIAQLIAAGLLLAGLSPVVFAGPGPQYWETLRHPSQFKELKSGDKIAYVCNECKTVSVVTIEAPAQGMDHCKEGAMLTCPSCKKQVKVVLKRERNDPPTRDEVIYVNDQGKECVFVAKILENK